MKAEFRGAFASVALWLQILLKLTPRQWCGHSGGEALAEITGAQPYEAGGESATC